MDSLVAASYLTVDALNACIESFDYSSADRNSKPSTFTSLASIHMNAAEALCFIRNLPLIVGCKIPRDNPHWALILMLLDILDIIFAPEINRGLCSYLAQLIADHHEHFKKLYPTKRLLPKHHFLTHYPACMLRCGPPSSYWCMRFEARHNFFKQVSRVIHCFKNICKSLAKRSMLNLASSILSKSLFSSCTTIGPAVETVVCNLDDNVSAALCSDLNLCTADVVYIVNWVKAGHYSFSPKSIVIISVSEGIPHYGIIRHIVAVAGKTYVVIEQLAVLHYDEHFHAYKVEYENQVSLSCVLLDTCKDKVPLNCHRVHYENSDHLFIGVRYILF